MHAREWVAARVQSAHTRYVVEPKGFERRRGLVSFLTWAFVLSEMFGRDGVGPSSACASNGDEADATQAREDSAPQTTDVLARATSPPDEAGPQMAQDTSSSTSATMPVLPAASYAPLETLFDNADSVGAVLADPASSGTAHGGGESKTPAEDGSSTDNHPSAFPEQGAAGGSENWETPSLLQLSVSSDGLIYDGLFQSVGQIIDAVPIVGQVVGSTVEALTSTVDNVLGSVGGLLVLGAADGALASGGWIEIDTGMLRPAFDAIQTAQGFTDYGIALELDASGGGTSLLSVAAAPLADFINLGSAFLPTPGEPGLSDEAGQRASGDLLA